MSFFDSNYLLSMFGNLSHSDQSESGTTDFATIFPNMSNSDLHDLYFVLYFVCGALLLLVCWFCGCVSGLFTFRYILGGPPGKDRFYFVPSSSSAENMPPPPPPYGNAIDIDYEEEADQSVPPSIQLNLPLTPTEGSWV